MKPGFSARRAAALAITLALLAAIVARTPVDRIVNALRGAHYGRFLALMVPNTIFYFCWDTLVLQRAIGWFHGEVAYRDLLPVRAASYVVGFFNTNVGRGALAAFLWRRLDVSLMELGGTVIFLVITEYMQLVLWAMSDMSDTRILAKATIAAAIIQSRGIDPEGLASQNKDISNHKLARLRDLTDRIYEALAATTTPG